MRVARREQREEEEESESIPFSSLLSSFSPSLPSLSISFLNPARSKLMKTDLLPPSLSHFLLLPLLPSRTHERSMIVCPRPFLFLQFSFPSPPTPLPFPEEEEEGGGRVMIDFCECFPPSPLQMMDGEVGRRRRRRKRKGAKNGVRKTEKHPLWPRGRSRLTSKQDKKRKKRRNQLKPRAAFHGVIIPYWGQKEGREKENLLRLPPAASVKPLPPPPHTDSVDKLEERIKDGSGKKGKREKEFESSKKKWEQKHELNADYEEQNSPTTLRTQKKNCVIKDNLANLAPGLTPPPPGPFR